MIKQAVILAVLALTGCKEKDEIVHSQIVVPERASSWACESEGKEIWRGPDESTAILICEKRKDPVLRLHWKAPQRHLVGYIDQKTREWLPKICDTYRSGKELCRPASYDPLPKKGDRSSWWIPTSITPPKKGDKS